MNKLERYPIIRYGTRDGFYSDILARLGEAVAFDDLEMELVGVQGVNLRVATPGNPLPFEKGLRCGQEIARTPCFS
jgi:hypothetical protein